MRRRKKNDKRVLISPRNRSKSKKRRIKRPQFNNQRNRPPRMNNPSKASKTTIVFIIIALIAFVVGAGIGISMAMDDSSNQTTVNGETFENVTVEMTSNLNNSSIILYDDEFENIDYNNNEDIAQYNLTVSNVSF